MAVDAPYLEWSDWYTWQDVQSVGGAPDRPGVYRVRATERPGVARTIPRALNGDSEGFVYIGSGTLRERIGELLPSTSGQRHHTLGQTYQLFDFDRLCPDERLEVQWATVLDGKAAVSYERLLGEEYIRQYLSLPPGNLKQPGM